MICKNCQTENAEDAVFCKRCGKRLDGFVICPSCGAQCPDDALFCSACGKSLCPEQAVSPTAEKEPNPPRDEDKRSAFQKVKFGFDLAGWICAVLAVFFALLFTFFIGVTARANVVADSSTVSAAETSMIWRYFGSGYTEISEMLDGLDEYSGYFDTSLYFPVILGTIISSITLLLTTSFSVTAAIKYAMHFKNPENEYGKYAVATVFSYLAGVSAVYALESSAVTSLSDIYNSVSVSLSGATVAGVVLSAAFIGLYFICKIVTLGKELLQKSTIVELACTVAGIVFATIAVSFACRYSMKLSVVSRTSSGGFLPSLTTSTSSVGLNSVAANLLLAVLYEGSALEEGLTGAYFVNLTAQIFQLLTLAFGITVLIQCVNSEKEKQNSRLWLAVTFFAISLVHLILACVGAALSAQYVNDVIAESGSSSAQITVKAAVSAGAIVALVMSAITLIAVIVQRVCCPRGNFSLPEPKEQEINDQPKEELPDDYPYSD